MPYAPPWGQAPPRCPQPGIQGDTSHSGSRWLYLLHPPALWPWQLVDVPKSNHLDCSGQLVNEEWERAHAIYHHLECAWASHLKKSQNLPTPYSDCQDAHHGKNHQNLRLDLTLLPLKSHPATEFWYFMTSRRLGPGSFQCPAARCLFFTCPTSFFADGGLILEFRGHISGKRRINALWTLPPPPPHEVISRWVIRSWRRDPVCLADDLHPPRDQFCSLKWTYIQVIDRDEGLHDSW